MTYRLSRRGFLGSATALAAPLFVPGAALGLDGATPANDRITMGLIGAGGQGTGDMNGFLGFPEVKVMAVCDPVEEHRANAKRVVDSRYKNNDCVAYNDFRELLSRSDIDTVLCGTPDHWHALVTIAACRSGKDVYCEKPESLTIREGRAMVDAARRYGRVVSGGSQRVMDDYGPRARAIRSGAVGQVKQAFVDCGGPSEDGYYTPEPMPQGVDWNLWLGPAPYRPFADHLIHGGFRQYRDFSGGGMTDWGAHNFGGTLFALDLQHTGPAEIIPPDGKDVKYLTYKYPGGLEIYHGGSTSGMITFKGTEGTFPGPHSGPDKGAILPGYKGRGGIFGDFLHCVRTRERPFRDIELAHRCVSVCHLGNIAYWLKRPLRWDPVKEAFIGDDEANRWLDRPKRDPWSLG